MCRVYGWQEGVRAPATRYVLSVNDLIIGGRSVRSFGEFLVETLFRPNPFIFPNYFLALHVPLWNRHNERRLLRFGFDILKSWKNFEV